MPPSKARVTNSGLAAFFRGLSELRQLVRFFELGFGVGVAALRVGVQFLGFGAVAFFDLRRQRLLWRRRASRSNHVLP